jgi:signal transduction histidine kinase
MSSRLATWLLSGLLVWAAGAAHAQVQTLELRSATTAADGPSDAGTVVRLPDDWSRTRPDFAGPLWYRVRFDLPSGLGRDDLLGLFIEHVCSGLEVYLNGHLVRSDGHGAEPLANNCNDPQLISLPSALLAARANSLDLQVTGYALGEVGSRQRAGGLSSLKIGLHPEMASLHARMTAVQVWAPQAVSATLALMGGFMIMLGVVNRRESHLAYFGVLSLGWALIDARLWLRNLPFSPVSHASAEFLVCLMVGIITWAAVQFLLRYARVRHRLADVGLPVQCGLLALSLIAAGPTHLYLAVSIWYAVLTLEVVGAALWHVHHQWHTRSVWLMATLLAAASVAGVIEFATQWTGVRPLAAQAVQLVVPIVFVLVGLRLVQQHGQALYDAQQGKAQLEQRVREATAEIERNFRQLAELRVEQVTERERKRIAADLHDDLGAKLLTIVHTSDSERISTLAREALEEMRLSVRGLTGKPVRLADALGDWRAEVVSRLGQAGIDGEWEAPEDLPQTLSARAYVQTTRILREATSNVIKHSGATNCSITAGIADGDFQLVVQDNGDGISSEVDGRLDRGHGLASMKNRAKQLQGQCLVESGAGYGTVIRLTVPLDRATQPS